MMARVCTSIIVLIIFSFHSASAKENDSLDIKIGQMIMIGINDRVALGDNDKLVDELKQGLIGGVVLFEKNLAKMQTKESLKLLIQGLQKNATIPLFISIDEEGGKVHRLKEKYGFISMPSAEYLGHIDNVDSTRFYNRKLAALFKELGINMNYAPSLDVAINPSNPVIVRAGRSFNSRPSIVLNHAIACIEAHNEYRIITVVKHFPGHGSSSGDSHLGVVDVSKSWQLDELSPFNFLIQNGFANGVMTAHIINKRWDDRLLPATLSNQTIRFLLRGLLGFDGVVISDDMQMDAIAQNFGFENAILQSINAGVDILMFANTTPHVEQLVTAGQIHAIIRQLVIQGRIPLKRLDEAYGRIIKLKQKYYL